jgi:hypothetical protein
VQASCSAPRTVQATDGPQEPAYVRAHDAFSRGVQATGGWIDRFLSDQRTLQEENRSWVSLRLDALTEEEAGYDADLRLQARLVLPKSQDRLQLLLSGESDAENDLASVPGDTVDATPPAADAGRSDLALQYVLKRTRSNNIRLEGGARFEDFEPDAYVGLRWRHTALLDAWALRATERLREYADAGLQSRTTLDLERLVGETLFFRASTRATWAEDEPGWEYGQRLALYQPLDADNLVTWEADTAFVTEPEDALEEGVARLRFSHRFPRRWILFEIAPQLAWRQEDDYAAVPGLLVSLEVSFGREF